MSAAQPTPGQDRTCNGCGIPVVPYTYTPPSGFGRYLGRGLCTVCYARARRLNALPPGRWKISRSRDFDEIAVARLVNGTLTGTPSTVELTAAVGYLDRHGYSARQIAERLRCARRTVQRHRAIIRAQALEAAS